MASNKKWTEHSLIEEGCKYSSRSAFQNGSAYAYSLARKLNLLDLIHPNLNKRFATDEVVIAEAQKYPSKSAFANNSPGAYNIARERNLLCLVDFPESGKGTDNDAIYIWRAVGLFHNGNPVYKIGVTSARLGDARVEQVANAAGFEYELICCEPVQCRATDIERKLHILGEDPGYTGFNGATEFRALSDSALYAAISLICGVM